MRCVLDLGPDPFSPASASGSVITARPGPGTKDRDRDAPEFCVDFSRDLMTQLDVLTQALDASGDDLGVILAVLVEDLSAGTSSFAGLSITVTVDDEPVTLTAMNSATAAASLLLPLGPGNPTAQVVLYAQNPGAFIDLAADAQFAMGPACDIVIDGHLPPPTAVAAQRSLDLVSDRSSLNQALGFLIEEGHPPGRAQAELARRAAAAGATLPQMAREMLETASATRRGKIGPH